jgi:hypothetical protein
MIVEVTTGSMAIIKPEAAARRYFHFVDASPNPRDTHLPGPRMRHNRMTDYLSARG